MVGTDYGAVVPGDLAQEEVEGPAVGDHMVQAHDQDVVLGRDADERHVPQRSGGEVERPLVLGLDHRFPGRGW